MQEPAGSLGRLGRLLGQQVDRRRFLVTGMRTSALAWAAADRRLLGASGNWLGLALAPGGRTQTFTLGGLEVRVKPLGPGETTVLQAGASMVARWRERQGSGDWRLANARYLGADRGTGTAQELEALVFDHAGQRAVRLRAPLTDLGRLSVSELPNWQPVPDDDEWELALAVLRASQPQLLNDAVPYRPMPPFVLVPGGDGRSRRLVGVGLRGLGREGVRHRIVGVDVPGQTVVTELPGAPQPSARNCGTPGVDDLGRGGRVGEWEVTVSDATDALWQLRVVRPAASSGVNGSGIELRDVRYRGAPVLARAHVPIMNVLYDENAEGCGPTYRDWFNQEVAFQAEGTDVRKGLRVCEQPPQTIADGHGDAGNFKGVALHVEDGELVLVSETSAGWYRYVSQWRLHTDGTIRPRVNFNATENPCTCIRHVHHGYFRLDFALGSGGDTVVEFDGAAPGRVIQREEKRTRAPQGGRSWVVQGAPGEASYRLRPGHHDGIADGFGVGDVWVLAQHPDEIDDGQGFTTEPDPAAAQLDAFVDGESVTQADLVVWYGVHYDHDHAAGTEGHEFLGPDLVPQA